MKQIIFKIVGIPLKIILFFILSICIYLLLAFIISAIPVSKEKGQINQTIPCYIISNGVHTDIVVPVKNQLKDWTVDFPYQNNRVPDSTMQYLAIGWGDKGFYMETKSWGELKMSVAFKCVFGLSESALHVTYYKELKQDQHKVNLFLNERQYKNLIAFIEKSIERKNEQSMFIKTHMVYSDNDSFYESTGTYSLFNTCNTWTNQALKAAGQNACLWTAFHDPIYHKYD